MSSDLTPRILHDPRYPDGWAIVLAWDYTADTTSERSVLLLTTSRGRFMVHRSTGHATFTDDVHEVERDEALRLYNEMPIHFAPFPAVGREPDNG